MEKVPVKKLWLLLSAFWLLYGLVTHIAALMWKIQYKEPFDAYFIFDIGFYYYIPVILWTLYTPFFLKLYLKYPIWNTDWKKHFFFHLIISLAFAPISRVIAISIDYAIKNLVGMASTPVFEIIQQAKYVIVASAPRSLLFYWIIIGVVITWKYFYLKKKSDSLPAERIFKQQLLIPQKNSKKILAVDDIYWIGAAKNYVNIYTADDCFKLRKSMMSLYTELDGSMFCQIHRSVIVNKHAIESLSHWRRGEYLIKLKNDKVLTSSRTYLQDLKEMLSI